MYIQFWVRLSIHFLTIHCLYLFTMFISMLSLNVYFWEGKKNAGKPSDMILPLFMNSAKISKLLLMHFSIVRLLMFFFHIDQPCISPHPKEKTLIFYPASIGKIPTLIILKQLLKLNHCQGMQCIMVKITFCSQIEVVLSVI